ncbi:MAG: purine-nucleoside phosphorylase [Xanthomonadales bacterium]|nr:purine-nucleoside phosphorylase [Xanthomonadales bacterium]
MAGTPHIAAEQGDFAELVLMPGDPLRARTLAQNHLEGARCVNEVRNMLAYTGNWRGTPVSIMGSGMGMPSISIYAHELFEHFGVRRIVRVGTCGGLLEEMQLGDLVLASAASTDSAMNRQRFNDWDYAAAADPGLLQAVHAAAVAAALPVRVGEIFSTDFFYHPDADFISRAQSMRILGLDMETAALYALARAHGRKALTLLSVSDVIPTGLQASTEARQSAFGSVIELVLDALLQDD